MRYLMLLLVACSGSPCPTPMLEPDAGSAADAGVDAGEGDAGPTTFTMTYTYEDPGTCVLHPCTTTLELDAGVIEKLAGEYSDAGCAVLENAGSFAVNCQALCRSQDDAQHCCLSWPRGAFPVSCSWKP